MILHHKFFTHQKKKTTKKIKFHQLVQIEDLILFLSTFVTFNFACIQFFFVEVEEWKSLEASINGMTLYGERENILK